MQRKKHLSVLALCGILLLLCGCTQGQSLGERAIVKAVYVNPLSTGQVEAALVVFSCEPASDTSSASEKAQIFAATGKNLEEALYKAERQQNKSVFYAQNQLLFIGPGAMQQDISPYLSYFGQEDVGRLNLAVYLVPLDGETFSDCTDVMKQVIQEGERLTERNLPQANPSRSIYESIPEETGENGWLPILEFSQKEDTFIGVRKAALFQNGHCYGIWDDAELQLALLLSGKSKSLTLQMQQDGTQISVKTRALSLERTVTRSEQSMCLQLTVSGKTEHLSVDGEISNGQTSTQAIEQVDAVLEETARKIIQQTFYRGNDVFQWEWWLRCCDAAQIVQWQTDDLWRQHVQIQFECDLQDA